MNSESKKIQSVYLSLLSIQTVAASLIWGVNTLFLLDAGLSIFQAFAANAFFAVGQVLFDIPTGIIADGYGRRLSYLLGAVTLSLSTLAYLYLWKIHAVFWLWALVSIVMGIGFTFFSGANDAWLVDALTDSAFFKENGSLEEVFGRGQVAMGVSMLIGSVAGGYIAQLSNLGVPYLIRAILLSVNFTLAYFLMFDRGFSRPEKATLRQNVKNLVRTSIDAGLRDKKLRWMMLTSPFINGVMMYVFYTMQPYLLSLYGNSKAYGIAGLAAAIAAGAQIVGGASVKYFSVRPQNATKIIFTANLVGGLLILTIGQLHNFYLALILLAGWCLIFSISTPVRQSYLNRRIASNQRATLLSLDSVLGSCGSAATQPLFGKVADLYGYPASIIGSGIFQLIALPFIFLAGRQENLKEIT